MKIKVKKKDCHLVIRVKAAFGESIDKTEFDKFASIYLRGFLRPCLTKKNQIEYTGPIGISLFERLKRPLTKREFLFIIEQIVVAVQKLQTNSLPLNNLLMNIQYAYINEVTKEVQFIYVPITNLSNGNIIEFIESIVYSVRPSDEKDTDYVQKFIYFFKALKPFNMTAVEEYIAKEDRSVVNTIKRQDLNKSGFMTNKRQHYYEHYDEINKEIIDDEKTGLLDEEKTGLLLEDSEKTGLLNQDDEPTGVLDSNENEGTALLLENRGNVTFPKLFRVLTDEKISINKPVFRLGKERSYVDYFVTNNVAVSRSHADIITRGNRYFVKDLNSKNHTYVNDKEIPVNFEVEICDGDKIKLGNEEFIFNI